MGSALCLSFKKQYGQRKTAGKQQPVCLNDIFHQVPYNVGMCAKWTPHIFEKPAVKAGFLYGARQCLNGKNVTGLTSKVICQAVDLSPRDV